MRVGLLLLKRLHLLRHVRKLLQIFTRDVHVFHKLIDIALLQSLERIFQTFRRQARVLHLLRKIREHLRQLLAGGFAFGRILVGQIRGHLLRLGEVLLKLVHFARVVRRAVAHGFLERVNLLLQRIRALAAGILALFSCCALQRFERARAIKFPGFLRQLLADTGDVFQRIAFCQRNFLKLLAEFFDFLQRLLCLLRRRRLRFECALGQFRKLFSGVFDIGRVGLLLKVLLGTILRHETQVPPSRAG